MKNISFLIVALLLILICNNPCFPQQSQISSDELKNLKKDIDALKEGQTAIQKDLQEIKNLLRAKQTPQPPEFKETTISIQGDQFKGNKEAKVVLIEFMDYQ
jgi:mRNA-degrading endonuclease YafQ of YafQ-DinJ toxin-antitoxin module